MSSDEVADAKEEVIESMERSAEVYGLSRSAGRVYGVLYFAQDSLSIPELVETTGYAKSTISNVTRKLTRIGLIRRRSSAGGGRRVRFEAERDLWFIIQGVVQQYVQREIGITQRTLERSLDRLEATDNEAIDAELERVRELQTTYGELETFLELAVEHSIDELITAIRRLDE